jgi:hypothetical protein
MRAAGPSIMPPSCAGQEGQALVRLYQRAAFRVKQESGFVLGDVCAVKIPVGQ